MKAQVGLAVNKYSFFGSHVMNVWESAIIIEDTDNKTKGFYQLSEHFLNLLDKPINLSLTLEQEKDARENSDWRN
jgi:hypothetical protein